MRASEGDIAHLRGGSERWPGRVRIDRKNFAFSKSDSFFPLELGDDSDGEIVALLAYTQHAAPLDRKYDWVAIEHQCGGYQCHQMLFVGIRLHLRPAMHDSLKAIAKSYRFANNGYLNRSGKTASDVEGYHATLRRLGLSCDHTYSWLAEAVYPIDADARSLSILTASPPDLNDFGETHQANFGVFVLSVNSD